MAAADDLTAAPAVITAEDVATPGRPQALSAAAIEALRDMATRAATCARLESDHSDAPGDRARLDAEADALDALHVQLAAATGAVELATRLGGLMWRYTRRALHGARHGYDGARGPPPPAEDDSEEASLARALSDARIDPTTRHHVARLAWYTTWQLVHERQPAPRDAAADAFDADMHARALHLDRSAWPDFDQAAMTGGSVRGVSLAGWLCCERWMQHALFSSAPADVADEFRLAQHLHPDDWHAHRSSWVGRVDLERMRGAGLNSVRVPFGYWLLQAEGLRRKPAGPYEGERAWLERAEPYHGPDEEVLSRLLDDASAVGLRVQLCLQGAPGGQSGEPSCGFADPAWRWEWWDVAASVRCVARIAARWGAHPALHAIGLLDSPSPSIPTGRLAEYYELAYDAVRAAGCSVLVVMDVSGRPWAELERAGLAHRHFRRVQLCARALQCYGNDWATAKLDEHLRRARTGSGHVPSLDDLRDKLPGQRALVSAWSAALPTWQFNGCTQAALGLASLDSDAERDAVRRALVVAQLRCFARLSGGHYFFAWKVDDGGSDTAAAWSYERLLQLGWMPPRTDMDVLYASE